MATPHPIRRSLLAAALKLGLTLGLGLATTAGAAPAAAPAPLAAADQALVDRASAYLGGLDEMKGRFVQTDPRGNTSQGELYLKRPGRARFAYDPPSGQLVVSDGFNVSVSDPRLKTFDRYPLGSTPLSLFLAKDVRLDRGVQVTRVTRFSDGFALTARDSRHPNGGEVTLSFSDQPMRLREWSLTSAQGQVTRVRITSLETASGLDPALFVLRDPRPGRNVGAHP
ncbi:MAG: outer-membrane lipoprotein carrier protein LolA [Caulobacteraceae bacterium]|nr:outer-membrane lipoprotein carrier protein LolA [Caulobacteraceae bacterium]